MHQFRKECQINKEAEADYDSMKEKRKLKKQLSELQKENDFLKKRKANYHRNKAKIKKTIRKFYHAYNGAPCYRIIHIYLCRKGYDISCLTVHKYVNRGTIENGILILFIFD